MGSQILALHLPPSPAGLVWEVLQCLFPVPHMMGVGWSFQWLSPFLLIAVGAPLSKYTAAHCRGRPAGSQILAITNSAALDAPGCVLCCECVSISGWSTLQEFRANHLLDHPPTWLYQFMFPPVVGGFHGVTSSSAPGIFCLFI